jgi:hypothetical protein
MTTNLLSLDASLVIPTRVLSFEVSGLRRRTPVRMVLLIGQTGTHRSDQSGAAASRAGYRASSACYSSARYGSARLHPGSAWLVIVTSQQVSSARLAI